MLGLDVVAIPSVHPGGLEAARCGHFGRCDLFTLVDLADGELLSTRVIPNGDHAEGGCLVLVQLLQQAGVTSLVVSGIGLRPRIGFSKVGIRVLVGPGETVGEVVQAYRANLVRPVTESDLCGPHTHGHA